MTTILLVDDHELVRAGLRALLEREERFDVVGEAGTGEDAIRLARKLEPEIVVMDLSLPGGLGGLEATEEILRDHPETRILVLTQYEDREYIRRAIRIGARGYLLKRSASGSLVEAIRAISAGRRYLDPVAADELAELVSRGGEMVEDDYERLTPRERQVLRLLAEGKTSREIARILGVSLKTAMTHRSNLMGKLGLHSRTEVVRYAIRKGLLPVDEA